MIQFDEITAFRLVRRLALGQDTFAMYLLVCSDDIRRTIEEDLKAESDVQLGLKLPFEDIETLIRGQAPEIANFERPVSGFHITNLNSDIISVLDTHVVRLARAGHQLLFLVTDSTAEQLIIQAPNFRNRITEVLRIIPDQSIGERTA